MSCWSINVKVISDVPNSDAFSLEIFFYLIFFNFLVELVLKRLGLEDLLNSEMKCMEEIASLWNQNCETDPFEFRKDSVSSETHIAQTQAILASIHRQNQEKSRFFENEGNDEGGVKRKQSNGRRSQPPKKIRFSHARTSSSSDTEEDIKISSFKATNTTEHDSSSQVLKVNRKENVENNIK